MINGADGCVAAEDFFEEREQNIFTKNPPKLQKRRKKKRN